LRRAILAFQLPACEQWPGKSAGDAPLRSRTYESGELRADAAQKASQINHWKKVCFRHADCSIGRDHLLFRLS
jgi:hypothetical protein